MTMIRAFCLAPLAVAGFVGLALAQSSPEPQSDTSAATTLDSLVAADDLVGREVFIAEDEPVGTITAILHDEAGAPSQIVLTLEEIGTEGRQVTVPWALFTYSDTIDAIMLNDLDYATLYSYPEYIDNDTPGNN